MTSPKLELLPDSRAREAKGSIKGPGGEWSWIFCANCGKRGGRCLDAAMNFAFWLCNPCYETYGELTNMLVMPDEMFWSKLQEAQMNEYGRVLDGESLLALVEADASPLATLIKQGR